MSKEAFEQWHKNLYPSEFIEKHSNGDYACGYTAAAWEGWQAALSQQASPQPAVPGRGCGSLPDGGYECVCGQCAAPSIAEKPKRCWEGGDESTCDCPDCGSCLVQMGDAALEPQR